MFYVLLKNYDKFTHDSSVVQPFHFDPAPAKAPASKDRPSTSAPALAL